MALELLPDGKTFKKLTAAQTKAMERYYKRATGEPLSKSLALPSALIAVAGIGAIAYIFKDKAIAWFEEQKLDFVEWIKGLPVAAGGIVADTIVKGGGVILDAVAPGAGGPATPEFIIQPDGLRIGPLSICQRWENDAADWLTLVQSKNLTATEKTLAALTAKRITTNMKREGCAKPGAFTQAQWDD